MPLKDYLDCIPKLRILSMKKNQFACVVSIVCMCSDFYNICGLIAYNIIMCKPWMYVDNLWIALLKAQTLFNTFWNAVNVCTGKKEWTICRKMSIYKKVLKYFLDKETC